MAKCILFQTPLSPNEHTLDFENKVSQYNYFLTKFPNTTVEYINTKSDGFRDSLTLKISIDSIRAYDYLILSDGTKNYYYFIMGMYQETKTTSTVSLLLDVMQTYLDEYYFLECFMDRCHVPRWTADGLPTDNNVDEGIEYGSMIRTKSESLYDFKNNFIVCTTSPIGVIGTNADVPTPPTGGNWEDGVPSSTGFRYMKGWEGFAKNQYNDSGGVPTIGYGTTESDGEAWASLTSQQPISEELASKTAYNSFVEKYGKPIVEAVKAVGVTEQRQFDALIDLAYNAGVGRITNPNGKLMLALQRDIKDEAYISDIWKNYIISDAQGNVLQGLKDRREDECNMFFGKKFTIRAIVTINSDGSYGPTIKENNGNGWLPS